VEAVILILFDLIIFDLIRVVEGAVHVVAPGAAAGVEHSCLMNLAVDRQILRATERESHMNLKYRALCYTMTGRS
jgi:hypothetical protein